MLTSSAKQKGRLLQQQIRDKLREKYLDKLQSEDIESRGMGQQGTDIILTPAAKQLIIFDIEAKAQENLNIWNALKQCEENSTTGRVPLLVFKRNRTETYCTLKLSDLLRLI
jgi:hypothetical protein